MNYKSLLSEIQNAAIANPAPDTIIVPSNKQLYNVNLDTREIDSPEFLSVQTEHYSETVYFLVDRYYDSMDLAQTTCVVQYIADGVSYIYPVPFCDISTYPGKMIIPWSISGSATQTAGTIKYVLRFYLIDDNSVIDSEGNYNPSEAQFAYSLSTLTGSSKILKGLPVEGIAAEPEYHIESDNRFFELIRDIGRMVDNGTTYWIDV